MISALSTTVSPLRGVVICLLFASIANAAGVESTQTVKPKKAPARFIAGKGDQVNQKWDRSRAECEYRLIKAELALAKSEKPYLVLNLRQRQLEMRLQGAIVWNYPLNIAGNDSSELQEFGERFMGSERRLVRPLLFKHLFASQARTPDSILAIVSQATTFAPELLQREIPERFQLRWADDLILDIRTDVAGKPTSKFKNVIVDIRQALARPFGEVLLIVKMPKDNALTLYRATEPGMATLIYPQF